MGRVGAGGPFVAGVVVALGVGFAWVPAPGAATGAEVATAPAIAPIAPTTIALDPGDPGRTEPADPAPAPTVRPAFVPTVPQTVVPPVPSTSPPPPSTIASEPVAPTVTIDPAEAALDRMRFDWGGRFPDWEVSFLGPRSGLRALTYPHERRIEVFVRSTDTAESLHRVLAHEIGHLVDVELNTNEDRDRWRSQRSLSSAVPWWPDDSDPDFASGAGDFAEAFAVWEAGIISQSTVAGQPTAADLELLRELVTG